MALMRVLYTGAKNDARPAHYPLAKTEIAFRWGDNGEWIADIDEKDHEARLFIEGSERMEIINSMQDMDLEIGILNVSAESLLARWLPHIDNAVYIKKLLDYCSANAVYNRHVIALNSRLSAVQHQDGERAAAKARQQAAAEKKAAKTPKEEPKPEEAPKKAAKKRGRKKKE